MALRDVSARTLALIAGAFILLAVFHVWSLKMEENGESESASRIRAVPVTVRDEQQGQQVEIASSGQADIVDQQLQETKIRRYVNDLNSAEMGTRRAAALRLLYSVDSSARVALLRALKDEDPKVAEYSAKALLRLWQQADSPAVAGLFERGLTAYSLSDSAGALEVFNRLAELDSRIPDLYRLRAEILLGLGEVAKALADCHRALDLAPEHFLALYIGARCHARQEGHTQQALEWLEKALSIYPHFAEARQMKDELLGAGGEAE